MVVRAPQYRMPYVNSVQRDRVLRANDETFARALDIMERYLAAQATEIAAPCAYKPAREGASNVNGTGLYRVSYPKADVTSEIWMDFGERGVYDNTEQYSCDNPTLIEMDSIIPPARAMWEVSYTGEPGFMSRNIARHLCEFCRAYDDIPTSMALHKIRQMTHPKYYDITMQVASELYQLDVLERRGQLRHIKAPNDIIIRFAMARHAYEILCETRDTFNILQNIDFNVRDRDFGLIASFGMQDTGYHNLFSYSSLVEHDVEWWKSFVASIRNLRVLWSIIATGDESGVDSGMPRELIGDAAKSRPSKTSEEKSEIYWRDWMRFGQENGYDQAVRAAMDGVPAEDIMA